MTNLATKLLNMHEERTVESTTQDPALSSTPECISLFKLNQYTMGTYEFTQTEKTHVDGCIYCSTRSRAMTQVLKNEGYSCSQNAKGGQK